MANRVWTLEDVNLFCGDAPNNNQDSNHLVLTEMKLPGLDAQYTDHRAGGAMVNIEINNMIGRLEATFVLVGMTGQVMKLVNSWAYNNRWFTAFGVIRDQQTGQVAQGAALIKGQLGRADPQNWTRGNVLHTTYAIRGIMHYEFYIAGDRIYLWDYFNNTLVVGVEDQTAVINSLLHTGNTNAAPLLTTDLAGWKQPSGDNNNATQDASQPSTVEV
jgi:hypothetical protein